MSEDLKKAPLIGTYLGIGGSGLDPDMCSAALGLKPSFVWPRDARSKASRRVAGDYVSCKFEQGKKPFYRVDDAVTAFLDIIWPVRNALENFVDDDRYDVAITCSMKIDHDRPVYTLSANTIIRLAVLGCEFNFDIYDYSNQPYE